MTQRESAGVATFSLNLASCDSCNQLLASEIFQCQNHHILCGKCSGRAGCLCTTSSEHCRRRSPLLEKLIGSFRVNCVNMPVGCQELLPIAAKATHEAVCVFAPFKFKCIVCDRRLRLAEYAVHLESVHQIDTIELTGYGVSFGTTLEASKFRSIKIGEQLFLLHCEPAAVENWSLLFVTVVESSQVATGLIYEVSVVKDDHRLTIATAPNPLVHSDLKAASPKFLMASSDSASGGRFKLEVCIKPLLMEH